MVALHKRKEVRWHMIEALQLGVLFLLWVAVFVCIFLLYRIASS